MTLDPQHTHMFITPRVNNKRPERQHKAVFVFNQNYAIMEAYECCYFVENSIEQNNRSLITTLEPILDQTLYSVDQAVAQVIGKIELVIHKRNQVRNFE